MKVGDWMTSGMVGIPPSTRIGDALATMLRLHVNGLAVVDEAQHLLGVVTLSDIRRRVLPTQQDLAEREDYLSNPQRMEDRFEEVALLPVEQVMTKSVATVSPGENVLKAGALMNARRVKQLPVVADGRVVGMLTPGDIAWGFLTKYRRAI